MAVDVFRDSVPEIDSFLNLGAGGVRYSTTVRHANICGRLVKTVTHVERLVLKILNSFLASPCGKLKMASCRLVTGAPLGVQSWISTLAYS